MSDSNQVVTVDMYHPDTPDYCFLPPPSIEHPFGTYTNEDVYKID